MDKVYRLYNDDMEQIDYEEYKVDPKNSLHWGQRKLLISEIEFLTKYNDEYKNDQDKILLYIGSADRYILITCI